MAMSAEKTSEFDPLRTPEFTAPKALEVEVPEAPGFKVPEALEFEALGDLVGRYVRSPLGRGYFRAQLNIV